MQWYTAGILQWQDSKSNNSDESDDKDYIYR